MRNLKGKDVHQNDEEYDVTVATEATTNASVNLPSISSRASQSRTGIGHNVSVVASNNHVRNTNNSTRREQQLYGQTQRLLLVSLLSTISFLLATFSITSLVFFASSVFTIALAGQATYERIIIQINRNGLLYYIPPSIQRYLANMSIHEFMTDTTFFMEYRHLMLYFIPGLSEQDLMNLIQQLPERRRRFLLDRGQIGQLLLSQSIRDCLYPIAENNDELLLINHEHTTIPSDLVWEDGDESQHEQTNNNDVLEEQDFDDSNDEQENHIMPIPLAVPILPVPPTSQSEAATNPDWEQDGHVLNQAYERAMGNYSSSFTEYMLESVSNLLTPTRLQRSARFTGFLAVSTLAQWTWTWSIGLGYNGPSRILSSLGYGNNEQSITRSNDSSNGQNGRDANETNSMGRMFLSSTIFMGVSTGLLYYTRLSVRRAMFEARQQRNKDGVQQNKEKMADMKKDTL